MLFQKLIRQPLLLSIIGLVFVVVVIFYFFQIRLNQSKESSVIHENEINSGLISGISTTNQVEINLKPEKIDFGLPISLNIPKINVSSTVEYVGLTSEGAMDVPKDQNNVAWLKTGPRPGEKGNAVIDGHYGWRDGKPSVFDNLYKLRPGDIIYVSDELGDSIPFVVKELKRYSAGANVTKVFISDNEKSHLNLITCEGDWDKDSKSYSTRLVIFADKEIN